MKWSLLVALVLTGILSFTAAGQSLPCPPDAVCITRDAALKALADADRVKALEAELKVKDDAYAAQKDELNRVRVEFANVSGELSGLKQNAVQDRAIIEILIKNARPKKFGLINF
jgi:hypothetical protein